MLLLHILAVLLLFGRSAYADDDPIVEMPLGKVRGYTMTSRSGRRFMAFSSIPYAKPPVGELRFQPPEPVPLWRGIRDATEELPVCIQANVFADLFNSTVPFDNGVEDCLYLSVYTHDISGNAPVLFHIHGGGFAMGMGKMYGPEYLMDNDIVIVNINYRVGIFGFLTVETPEWPGNQGLKDQVLALQWVQQNIGSFGGDPNQVTLIGESAGGASVYHHIVSSLSNGLFTKAISESGSSYCPWALAPPGFAKSRAERLAAALDCPINPNKAIPCLQEKDPYKIVSKLFDAIDSPMEFGPVIEGPGENSFITGNLNKWSHNPVPLLMGITSAEGLMITLKYLTKDFDFKEFSNNFNKQAPGICYYHSTASDADAVTKEIRKFYLPNDEITMNDWFNLTTLTGDSLINIPVLEGANKHTGDVYFYFFDYIKKNAYPGMDEKLNIGANHCLEAIFIWNIAPNEYFIGLKEEDIWLSKSLVKLIDNFMKNGVPTIEGSEKKWNKWTAESHNYILIDNKGFHPKKGLLEERYKFWRSLNYRDKMELPTKSQAKLS